MGKESSDKSNSVSSRELVVPGDLLERIAEKRGCLKRGGVIDHPRAESLLLRDFRAGKLGRLSFDLPETTEDYS